ncbi:hypothetical protein OKW21_004354 [Catalinimonas alkaloidigena]|nr:hypothetical protein [Catalinimonas alkaloidigena]
MVLYVDNFGVIIKKHEINTYFMTSWYGKCTVVNLSPTKNQELARGPDTAASLPPHGTDKQPGFSVKDRRGTRLIHFALTEKIRGCLTYKGWKVDGPGRKMARRAFCYLKNRLLQNALDHLF